MIQNQGDQRILETTFLSTYIRPCKKKTKKREKLRKGETKGREGEEKAEKMIATKKYTGPKKVPTQEASAKSRMKKQERVKERLL